MDTIFEPAPHLPLELVADGAGNVAEVFRRRVSASADRTACFAKRDGNWRGFTWRELYDRSAQAAQGLVELELEIGDRVAILGPTWPEWGIWDLGGHLTGLVTLGIYPKQSADQVRYLLEHSGCRAIFVAEEEELETVLEAARGNDALRAIVTWTDELAERFADADERVMPPSRFRGEALSEEAIDERLCQVAPEDTAILIYTSGTTGPPKGAMISHANIVALLNAQDEFIFHYQDDSLISFLPMAHATERNLGFYSRLNTGVPTAYATDIGSVLAEIQEVRPTIFGSVPRIFEKAYAKIQGEMSRKPVIVRKLFDWAVSVGMRHSHRILAGEEIPARLAMQNRLAHRLVFRKIHAAFGGRVRACITGAAPISRDILEFFWAIGLPIYEGYGMTEATVLTHINTEDSVRLGSVGRAVPPMECKIAEDGEILLRGPFVFQGYYRNDEATSETIVDGWLHTGDVGELDEDGFLRITDRKKHLIITAGGKNLAPANVERAIKSQSPLISQVHAHGDRRPYVSALIAPSPLETLEWGAGNGVLDPEEAAALGRELQADPASRSEALGQAMAKVVAESEFRDLFVEPVRRGNRDLARVEKVRRFFLLGRDLSQEAGEMTPTMKMKRKVIEEAYAEQFDRLYAGDDFAVNVEPE